MEVIQDAPQFCRYSLWLEADSLSAHSCNARAKDGVSIRDVFGFDKAVLMVLFLTILRSWELVG